jgi:hypothetical protein
MANDVRAGIGYLIPAGAIVGFFIALLMGQYLLSVFFAVAGILVWFLYSLVMETPLPGVLGNMIILFGVLLALGVFMTYGWEQNIFGGFEFRPEGSIFALIILFFSVLAGVLYNRSRRPATEAGVAALTDQERELVRKAVQAAEGEAVEPKVIVVKPEPPPAEEEEEKEEEEYDYGPYGPYAYAYPPEYYDEEYEEEEDEEEEEYEDEEEDEEEEEE